MLCRDTCEVATVSWERATETEPPDDEFSLSSEDEALCPSSAARLENVGSEGESLHFTGVPGFRTHVIMASASAVLLLGCSPLRTPALVEPAATAAGALFAESGGLRLTNRLRTAGSLVCSHQAWPRRALPGSGCTTTCGLPMCVAEVVRSTAPSCARCSRSTLGPRPTPGAHTRGSEIVSLLCERVYGFLAPLHTSIYSSS